ncbi:MAG: hypothetical protein ACPGVG_08745 [Mycobacterium sp.]
MQTNTGNDAPAIALYRVKVRNPYFGEEIDGTLDTREQVWAGVMATRASGAIQRVTTIGMEPTGEVEVETEDGWAPAE